MATQVGWVLLELPVLAPNEPAAEPVALDTPSPVTPARAAILSARKKAPSDPFANHAGNTQWELKHRPGIKVYLRVSVFAWNTARDCHGGN